MQGRSGLLFTSLIFTLAMGILFQGCSSSPPIPHPLSIELIQRTPIQTVQVNGQRVAYLESGQGQPLILIHGFGGSMWHWEYQYLALSQSYRVIIPDLINSGLSAEQETTYSPEYLIQFFRGFMKSLNIKQATLVGNSMGAGLAMAIALEHPEMVDRLVLISGFPTTIEANIASEQFRQFLEHRPPIWLANIANQFSGRRSTERLLKEIVYRAELISTPIIERSFQNRQQGELLPPLYSLLEHIDSWEKGYGQRISHVSHPTLLLWGEHDRIFPVEVGKQIHALLPQAEWHIIPESGHLPQWEQPHTVNFLIRSFLEKSL